MKRKGIVLFAFCVLLGACTQKGDLAHNSRNSLNWAGVYEGTVPGANSRIHVVITLNKDESFLVTTQYLDKSEEIFTNTGTFTWSADGSTITLKDTSPQYYQVGEGKLIQLDMSGKKITGELADSYELTQTERR
ncbi:hypothetical protein AGMMS50230_18260 [Spirochaetia bacterium]|nr:hypothetical protein AGMMS50230_18260 [Spirochaetia bacterium]